MLFAHYAGLFPPASRFFLDFNIGDNKSEGTILMARIYLGCYVTGVPWSHNSKFV